MLIVDDEKTTRKGIQSVIQWSAYGITIVGEGKNGEEGLELVRRESPDILLTDIRMPVMDGMDLIRHVREEQPQTKIVILSGHDDFSYAKEALHLGVKEYILKPFGAPELLSLILKLKEDILSERNKQNLQIRRRSIIEENYLLLVSRLVQTIISGDFTDTAEFFNKARILGCPLDGPVYRPLVISIDDYHRRPEDYDLRDLVRQKNSILNLCAQTFEKTGLFALSDFNQIIGILNVKDHAESFLSNLLEELIVHVKQNCGISLSVGVGHPRDSLESLSESFGTALTAVYQKVYFGKGKVHFYKEHMRKSEVSFNIPQQQEKKVLTSLLDCDRSGLKIALNTLFAEIKKNAVSVESVKVYASRIIPDFSVRSGKRGD